MTGGGGEAENASVLKQLKKMFFAVLSYNFKNISKISDEKEGDAEKMRQLKLGLQEKSGSSTLCEPHGVLTNTMF